MIKIVARLNPLESSVVACEIEPGLSLAEILKHDSDRIYVAIGDVAIPREHWAVTYPEEGAIVNIIVAPKGIVEGLLALAYAIGNVAGAVYSVVAPFLPAIMAATSLVSTAVSLFIQPQTPSFNSNPSALGRFYSLTQGANAANPYSIIPKLYGTFRITPPLAANYYTEIAANKQYLHVLLCLGYGPLQIGGYTIGAESGIHLLESIDAANPINMGNAILVGTTPIHEMEGIQWQIGTAAAIAGSSTNIFSRDIEEVQLSYALDKTVATDYVEAATPFFWAAETTPVSWVHATASNPAEISLDMTFSALFAAGGKTDVVDATAGVRFRVRYRKTGSGASWVNAYLDTHVPGASNIWEIKASSRKPIRRTNRFSVPSVELGATYDVEVTRISSFIGPYIRVYMSDATWSVIRTIKEAFVGTRSAWNISNDPDTANVILMAARVRSTGQLNGSLEPVSLLAQSVLPVWNGSGLEWQPTSNPAWAYADVLRGNQLQTPSRISDSQIDWAALKEWADWCEAGTDGKVFTYNWYHLDEETMLERLRAVSSTGRAAWALSDGRFSVVRDNKFTPVQMLSIRNSRNFEFSKTYPKVPNALRVRFVNEATWQPDETIVLDDGYYQIVNGVAYDPFNNVLGNTYGYKLPALYETLETQGVTNKKQAFREGRYYLAALRLRKETYTVEMDIENLVAQRGDCVLLSHDSLLRGRASGRIVSVTNGTQLTLDEVVELDSSATYCLRVRRSDGSIVVLNLVYGNGSTKIVSTTTVGNVSPGDLFVFGPVGTETILAKIAQIDYNPDLSAKLALVPAAPGILTADQGTILDDGSGTPDTPPELQEPPAPIFVDLFSNANDTRLTAQGLVANVVAVWSIPSSRVRTDSVVVYYSINNGDWQSQVRLAGDGSFTLVDIPASTPLSVYLKGYNQTSGKYSPPSITRSIFTDPAGSPLVRMPTDLDLQPSNYVTSDGVVHYEIRASWLLDGSSDGFDIQWQLYTAAVGSWQGVAIPGSTPQYTIKDILPGDYRVRVRNKSNIIGAVSNWLQGEVVVNIKDVAPNPPTNILANSTNAGVELTWTNPLDPDLAYIEIWESIYNNRATAEDIAQVFATQFFRPISDTALRYYWLRAVDTSGNVSVWAPSDALGGLPGRALGVIGDGLPPPAPASLTLTSDTWQVDLKWEQVREITDLVGTEIWFSKTNDVSSATKVVLTKENFYTQLNLDSNTTYYYWIRNSDVEGYFSDWYPSNPTGGQEVTVGKDPSDYLDLLGDLVFLVVPHPGKYVDTSTGEIIGDTEGGNPHASWYPEGVYIRNAMIKDGSLEGVKIKAKSITSEKIDTRGLDIRDADNNIIFSAGVGLNLSRVRDAGAFASLNKLLSSNIDLYIEDGAIGNAYIGDIIQSADFLPGQQGWKINKQGNIEVHNLSARGSMQSSLFVPGETGWKLDESGTAELNNAVIRGAIAAGTVIAGTDWTISDLTNSVINSAIAIAGSGFYFAFDEKNVCKSQQTLYFYANNASNPAWQATAYATTGSGVEISLGTDAQGNRTLTASQMTAGDVQYQRVEITATSGTASDKVTIVRLKDGDSAITCWLTNESANLASDPAGNVISYGAASGNIRVFQGTTEVTGACTFSVGSSTGMTVAVTSAGAYSTSNMTADSASATLLATYHGTQLSKVFTVSKARAGSSGGNGVSPLSISASALAFTFNSSGALVGASSISLLLTGDNASTATWTAIPYNSSGVAQSAITLGSSGTSRQLTSAQFAGYSRVEITATAGTLSDKVTIIRLADGVDSVSGYLTESNASVAAGSDGSVSSWSLASGYFKVFSGITDVTAQSSFTVVSGTASGGLTTTITSSGRYTTSTMSSDVGAVTFAATYNGVTITQVFTVSKVRPGATGATGASGSPGQRGHKQFIFSGSYSDASWVTASIDTLVVGAQDQGSLGYYVIGDVVTLLNTSTSYAKTRFRRDTGWIEIASYINGNMLVQGTLYADRIISDSLAKTDMYYFPNSHDADGQWHDIVAGCGYSFKNAPGTPVILRVDVELMTAQYQKRVTWEMSSSNNDGWWIGFDPYYKNGITLDAKHLFASNMWRVTVPTTGVGSFNLRGITLDQWANGGSGGYFAYAYVFITEVRA